MYAPGVQTFEMELRILKHAADYLIAEIGDGSEGDRSAVIGHISFEWLEKFAPALLLPPSGEWPETNLHAFLDRTLARTD